MSNTALLGEGILDGLISSSSQIFGENEPVKVLISKIHRWDDQPRCYFSEESIASLSGSFRKHGFKGVLIVRPHPEIEGDYQLIAGERRWRAANRTEITEVFCFIASLNDEAALDLALRENLNREDLSRLEETQGILNLIETRFSINPEIAIEIVNRQGRSNVTPEEDLSEEETNIKSVLDEFNIPFASFRTNFLPTLSLPNRLKVAHLENGLSYNSAKSLNRIKDAETLDAAIAETLDGNLSVTAVRKLVEDKLSGLLSTKSNKFEDKHKSKKGTIKNKPGQVLIDLKEVTTKLAKAKNRKAVEADSRLKNKLKRVLVNLETVLEELESSEE
ncbi:MAG: ParB/RepB/Spo0J family partition protein [Phormidesmis sp.]